MSIENLDKIFQPKSIAVVGASERKGSVGAALMRNLIERGFPGDIYPINPKHKKLWGKSAFSSIADLKNGRHFKVVELNGVTSEATNIYDPANSLWRAYGILMRQWKLAFQIGEVNRRNGSPPVGTRELVRLLRTFRAAGS